MLKIWVSKENRHVVAFNVQALKHASSKTIQNYFQNLLKMTIIKIIISWLYNMVICYYVVIVYDGFSASPCHYAHLSSLMNGSEWFFPILCKIFILICIASITTYFRHSWMKRALLDEKNMHVGMLNMPIMGTSYPSEKNRMKKFSNFLLDKTISIFHGMRSVHNTQHTNTSSHKAIESLIIELFVWGDFASFHLPPLTRHFQQIIPREGNGEQTKELQWKTIAVRPVYNDLAQNGKTDRKKKWWNNAHWNLPQAPNTIKCNSFFFFFLYKKKTKRIK